MYTDRAHSPNNQPQTFPVNSPAYPPPAYEWPSDTSKTGAAQANNRFSDRSIRRGFIRKVYGILTLQLLCTVAVIAIFLFVEPVKRFVQRNRWVEMFAIALFLGTIFTLICFEEKRRKTPTNYICLSILTLAQAYMTGALSGRYETNIVLFAMATTAIVTFSLTIFAIQTKIDFTLCSSCLCASFLVVMLMSFALSLAFFVFGYNRILDIVFSGIAALLFCMYLVYDTQLLMGGKRYALSEEDYIMAVIQLYLDIILIFTFILQIFGKCQS